VYREIVAGTDGSETAQAAVRHAGELAKLCGARLHLVSAYEPLTGVKLPEEAGAEAWQLGPTAEVDALLGRTSAGLRATGVEVESYARKGDPADAIIEVAEEQGADLVVVGSKGMRGTKRFLLGSVPNKVSHHAPCTVAIVRTV
jgi:nucleotide-binding universal stress UspA family protein